MTFVQNFPFFTILLTILAAILCMPLPARYAVRLTAANAASATVLSAAALAHAAATGQSYVYQMGHFPAPFGNELRVGPLETALAACFCFVLLCSFLGGLEDLYHDIPRGRQSVTCVMCNLLLAGMLAMVYTNDLFTAYVFIDIITIAACTVIVCKPGGRTLVATMTYLVMSLVGSGLVLLSIALLYNVTGHLLMPQLGESVARLMSTGQYRLPLTMMLGLMTVGLGIKSALFPFHVWLPDAHASATTGASSILSGLIIKCYLVLLVKIYLRIFGLEAVAELRVGGVLLLFGLAGLLWGSWRASRQTHIKRMLGYASVSQIGFLCACIGLGSLAGIAAACFHLLAHAAAKSMLFCAAGGLSRTCGHKKRLADLRGAGRLDPLCGAAFAVGALSMVGIPPLSGFFSKLFLSVAAFGTPLGAVVVIGAVVAGTLLSTLYYIPALACVLGKPPEGAAKQSRSAAQTAALWGFLLLNIGLGIFSQPILRILQQGLQVFG